MWEQNRAWNVFDFFFLDYSLAIIHKVISPVRNASALAGCNWL